jgi:toxin ParE1/3/4
VRVAFSAIAAAELDEAVGWCERRRRGLGARLHDSVQQAVQHLAEHPYVGTSRGDVKQLPVPGFPYLLVYEVSADDVAILALAHTRRRPGYWRQR